MSAEKRLQRLAGHVSQSLASSAAASPVAGFSKKPIKVAVTGAAGNICYSVLFMIGQGKMLGNDQPIELRLLDIPPMAKKIEGVRMELNDCAFPILTKIIGTTDYKEAFEGAEIALLIGARPRGPGMERKDLLTANAKIFEGQGKALNQYAHPNCKVLVVGNPANTNALITMLNAPRIPRENFTAMTRLDQNRAASQIAEKVGCDVLNVRNIIIWGNHSATQFPDVDNGWISDFPTKDMGTPIRAAVVDEKWLADEFIPIVQKRGAAIINARGASSAASAASAAVDHIRSWFKGTDSGEVVSMGVISNGEYGVPKDIIFSFPCRCVAGRWEIVKGFRLSDWQKGKLRITADELLEEKAAALGSK